MPENATDNLTNRQLKLSYWYITHKLLLRRWLMIFLLIISILIWFYIAWQITFYAIDYQTEKAMVSRLFYGTSQNLSAIEGDQPRSLSFSDVEAIRADNGRYDFMIRASNPNHNWAVTFDYQFATGPDRVKTGFILPGDDKYLMDLGLTVAGDEFKISNIRWQRVAAADNLKNSHLRFVISDEDLLPGVTGGDPNKVSFTVKNDSAFSYWNVGFQVFLYSGGNLVSFNYINVDKFKAGETRKIELNWNTRLPRVDNIEVVPEVNILDRDNFMLPEGKATVM